MSQDQVGVVLKQCLWGAIIGSFIHSWQGACAGVAVVLLVHAFNSGP